jgi:hypothetical protein
MMSLEMGSLRACSTAAIAFDVGQQGTPNRESDAHPGLVVTNWLTTTKAGARAATLDGRAGMLRKKYRRNATEQETAWRTKMGRCFRLIIAGKQTDDVKARIMALASLVGEEAYACKVLLPMIDGGYGAARISAYFKNHDNV